MAHILKRRAQKRVLAAVQARALEVGRQEQGCGARWVRDEEEKKGMLEEVDLGMGMNSASLETAELPTNREAMKDG
jgi:hypothetical protein